MDITAASCVNVGKKNYKKWLGRQFKILHHVEENNVF